MSWTQMFSFLAPSDARRCRQASAAAPAPDVTIFTSEIFLPASSSPLRMAAATMIAVPCWSSWKTGMFILARRRRSTSKHSGALMSSRLMPPKVGSSAETVETIASMLSASISMSKTSMPANFLNRTALAFHDGLGGERADIAEAEHRGAVRDDGDEIGARGIFRRHLRVVADGEAGCGDARRIGEREVALVAERLGGLDLELAGTGIAVEEQRLFVEIARHGAGGRRLRRIGCHVELGIVLRRNLNTTTEPRV